MSKEICISSTPHETRLAIIEDEQLTEVYYERENEYTLAGSVYKGRVTRVLPGMQSAFVDVGLERDAFLYVTDFLDEQEDSADFERVPAGEGARDRERSGRENKEPRAPRTQEAAPAPAREDAASEQPENFEGGTRRWRGRRGRRGRGPRPHSSQGTPQAGAGAAGATGAETGFDIEPEDRAAEDARAPEHQNYPEQAEHTGRRGRGEHGSQGGKEPIGFALPGESLSKYGGQPSASETADAGGGRERRPAASSSYKPSTLIESPLEWNGTGLLPGESLSRYRGAPEEPAYTHPEPPSLAADAPVDRFEDPLARAAAEDQPPHQDSAMAGRLAAAVPVPEAPEYEPEAHDDEQGAVESEPEDASASYRVDPSAPSEFRLSTPERLSGEEHEPAAGSTSADLPERAGQFADLAEAAAQRGDSSSVDQVEEDEQDRQQDGIPQDASAGSSGLLEEEEMNEEEEYDFTLLYDQIDDHDLEDMEEETLERQAAAGAEIDDLVRDEHLDRRIEGDVSDPAVEETGRIDIGDEEAEGERRGQEEEDDDEEDALAQDEPESNAAAPAQPGRRERQDQRRGHGRQTGRRRHNGRRQSAQTSDLPIISELLKQGQEILVQIAKEPIAKKGARITSHIALPGRFLVFMPTVNHVGVSRKISSDEERQRLKRILISEKGDGGGGFIVRTAADGASEDELRADIRFLISLWNEIKQRADDAKAPALIYHDLNLVERILRDQVSDNFSTIWVDNETEYERIVRFLNRFEPALVRHVKLYTKETPLFEQFGIQEEIGKALKSKVWLKSGGSIVINQTEALVAIDINTGKYVGKTARLEDTILKTNLDAIPEIVRQIRLRDLGGIIVIDFIDMDERKNRHKVMQALEEALKADRAPSKVLQFNDFGLVAITRKRVKQSLERTLCVPCAICAGTGMTKSPATVCNEIFVEMRKMQQRLEGRDVLLRVHPEVVKTLKSNNGRWLNELEEMIGKTIIVKSDPALPPEEFDIH